MQGKDADLRAYVIRLADSFGEIGPEQKRLAKALYRLLARGEPVTVPALARSLGVARKQVESLLREVPRGLIELDAQGSVSEFGGLGLAPSMHSLCVEGRRLFTWCAWDGLFIPPILGEIGEVESISPISGRAVQITVGPGGVARVDPPVAVMTFATPATALLEDSVRSTRFAFCDWIHFFASDEEARDWLGANEGPAIVSIAEAFELGELLNEVRFGPAAD